jgi:hypothetical protein
MKKYLKSHFRFFTLYFSDSLSRYCETINRGGIVDEDDFSTNLVRLSKDNYIEFFNNISKCI